MGKRGRPRRLALPADDDSAVQRFVRIIELPPEGGDHFPGFQPEIVFIKDDKVIKRVLVDKPNLFEYAYTKAGEFIDPRVEMVVL